jgi:hypothetical protein
VLSGRLGLGCAQAPAATQWQQQLLSGRARALIRVRAARAVRAVRVRDLQQALRNLACSAVALDACDGSGGGRGAAGERRGRRGQGLFVFEPTGRPRRRGEPTGFPGFLTPIFLTPATRLPAAALSAAIWLMPANRVVGAGSVVLGWRRLELSDDAALAAK